MPKKWFFSHTEYNLERSEVFQETVKVNQWGNSAWSEKHANASFRVIRKVSDHRWKYPIFELKVYDHFAESIRSSIKLATKNGKYTIIEGLIWLIYYDLYFMSHQRRKVYDHWGTSIIRSLDTIMLTSWAPHSLLFPCKEGAERSTYLCPCPLNVLKNVY